MSNTGIIFEKGDVQAQSTMTDNKVIRGAGDKGIQDSGVTIDDLDNLSGVNTLAVTDVPTTRSNLGLGSISTQDANSVNISGGSITGITDLAVADGGTGGSTAGGARANLGLGDMSTQTSSSVNITGGSVTGITDLAVTDGGTGASTASGARTNLGLGSMSTQNSDSVAITGGSITDITDLAVADGGTGRSSHTAYTPLCGGTTTTGAQQSVASLGSSGDVLTSNGAGALPSFQAPAGGGGGYPAPEYDDTGTYPFLGYNCDSHSLSSKTVTSQRMYMTPLVLGKTMTITKLGVFVSTAAGSSVARLGIYTSDGNGRPTTLLVDGGTVTTASTGNKTVSISQQLTASTLYFAACSINSSTVVVKAYFYMSPFLVESGGSMWPIVDYYDDAIDPTAALPNTCIIDGIETGTTAPGIFLYA